MEYERFDRIKRKPEMLAVRSASLPSSSHDSSDTDSAFDSMSEITVFALSSRLPPSNARQTSTHCRPHTNWTDDIWVPGSFQNIVSDHDEELASGKTNSKLSLRSPDIRRILELSTSESDTITDYSGVELSNTTCVNTMSEEILVRPNSSFFHLPVIDASEASDSPYQWSDPEMARYSPSWPQSSGASQTPTSIEDLIMSSEPRSRYLRSSNEKKNNNNDNIGAIPVQFQAHQLWSDDWVL